MQTPEMRSPTTLARGRADGSQTFSTAESDTALIELQARQLRDRFAVGYCRLLVGPFGVGAATMNRVAAITGQIDAIAEHITGPEGYSLSSLCELRNAILDAHDLITGETIRSDPSNDYRAKHDGGAA
jgi:hypothetical protein